MGKQWKNSRPFIRTIGYRLPLTWYFVLFAGMALLTLEWLRKQQRIPDTSFTDIFLLLTQVAVFFIAVLVGLALLTVLAAFLYLWWQRRRNKVVFSIEPVVQSNQPKQLIRLQLQPVFKPLLGFVKLRLRYDEVHFSHKFSVAEAARKKIFTTRIEGTYHWDLPEIREYTIQEAIVYFEDFFQFFSFTLALPTQQFFYTHPLKTAAKVLSAPPRKTEDTSTRIEELKKVEGEYLQYKHFENHDDVRRIVWKIYARNKELVVRTPEVLDPYASHIYLYASFYTAFAIGGNDVVNVPFLNYYKTLVWNAYQELAQQGFEVRYVPDQPIAPRAGGAQQVQYSISTSKWQNEKDLAAYLRPGETAILFISSLSDAEQVSQLVEQYGNEVVFVLVRLSASLRRQHIGDWLQWLFVQNERDATARYKTSWSLSLLRNKIQLNEKRLQQLLEKYQKPVLL